MPNPINTQLSLTEYINQFIGDAALTHVFVTGSETEEVVTANGSYPTIAKMVADNRAALSASMTIRTYYFTNAINLLIQHGMNTVNFIESIISPNNCLNSIFRISPQVSRMRICPQIDLALQFFLLSLLILR